MQALIIRDIGVFEPEDCCLAEDSLRGAMRRKMREIQNAEATSAGTSRQEEALKMRMCKDIEADNAWNQVLRGEVALKPQPVKASCAASAVAIKGFFNRLLRRKVIAVEAARH
jgi:hypothetical protein